MIAAVAGALLASACGSRATLPSDGGPRPEYQPPTEGGPRPELPPPDWRAPDGPRPLDWYRPPDKPWLPDKPWWPDKPWPVDVPQPVVGETVTCYFSGASPGQLQSCKSSKGQSCSGYSSCSVYVSGKYGEQVTWYSTCSSSGPAATSIIDGKSESIYFKCTPTLVTETVSCVFSGALGAQSCYSAYGSCTGVGSCAVKVTGYPGQSVGWTSSCGGGTKYTTIDGINESATFSCSPALSETVTCLFPGSSSMQECYSTKGAGCKGMTSCSTTVTGSQGEKVDWKSSCGGYATTIVDGKSETITFPCTPTTVSEIVTCWFKGSSTFQQCYSSAGSCQGLLGCTVAVKGPMGQAVQWKSSCGGYATTITDGKDESATFYCGSALDAGPPPPPWPDAGKMIH
jgi:hypothetical protein